MPAQTNEKISHEVLAALPRQRIIQPLDRDGYIQTDPSRADFLYTVPGWLAHEDLAALDESIDVAGPIADKANDFIRTTFRSLLAERKSLLANDPRVTAWTAARLQRFDTPGVTPGKPMPPANFENLTGHNGLLIVMAIGGAATKFVAKQPNIRRIIRETIDLGDVVVVDASHLESYAVAISDGPSQTLVIEGNAYDQPTSHLHLG